MKYNDIIRTETKLSDCYDCDIWIITSSLLFYNKENNKHIMTKNLVHHDLGSAVVLGEWGVINEMEKTTLYSVLIYVIYLL